MSNVEKVYSLISKAEKADDPNDAMKYSQAALNAANAIMGLVLNDIAFKEGKK